MDIRPDLQVLIPSEAGLWLNCHARVNHTRNHVLIPSEAGLWLNLEKQLNKQDLTSLNPL